MEQRKYLRIQTFLPVLITVLDQNKNVVWNTTFQGFTRDINKTGVCLEINNFDDNLAKKILENKYLLQLSIDFPNLETPIKVYSEPRWFNQSNQDHFNRFKIGVSFLDLKEKDSKDIIKYAYKLYRRPKYIFSFIIIFFILFLFSTFNDFKSKIENKRLITEITNIRIEKNQINKEYSQLERDYSNITLALEQAKQEILKLQMELNITPSTFTESKIEKLNVIKINLEQKLETVKQKQIIVEQKKKEIFAISISLSQKETDRMFNWIKNSQSIKTGLIGSYEGDRELEHISFTYDQALCIYILIERKDFDKAKNLIDFFVNRANKTTDGFAFFNAYSKNSGSVMEWIAHVGPNAWLGMAMLKYIEKSNDKKYLSNVINIANYILKLQDADGGIRGGENETWYATEHNLDVYSFFRMLYKVTGNIKYKNASDKTLDWLLNSAYIKEENRFMRGKNDRKIATDTVSFGIPAIGPKVLYEKGIDPEKLIKYMENKTKTNVKFNNEKGQIFDVEGFDYTNYERLGRKGVVSSEWTAQMITTYEVMANYFQTRDKEKYKYYIEKTAFYLNELEKMMIQSKMNTDNIGGLPYASKAFADTGHGWFTPKTENVISIAGTAYNLLARFSINPFMLDMEKEDYYS